MDEGDHLRKRVEEWADNPANARRLSEIVDTAEVLYGEGRERDAEMMRLFLLEIGISLSHADLLECCTGPDAEPGPFSGIVAAALRQQ